MRIFSSPYYCIVGVHSPTKFEGSLVRKYPSIQELSSSSIISHTVDAKYSQRPMDIDDLKEKIFTDFQKVTPQMLHHTWDAISSRYELCRLRNGGHVGV